MNRSEAREQRKSASDSNGLGRYQYLRRLWLFAGIIILAALLLVVSTAWRGEISGFIEAFGMALIGAGILGRLWCTLYIGGRKSDMVVITGPYSIMRNPLYFFSSIAALGVGAQAGSIVVSLVFGLLCAAAFRIVIAREEGFLSGKFGASYADYLASVPRFFPSIRLFRDEETLIVLPKRVYTTLMDGLVFFIAVPLFEFVEYLQNTGALPVLLRLY